MALTFTDKNIKTALRSDGLFRVVISEAVKTGDMLSFLSTGTTNIMQLADQSTSVAAHAIATEDGAAGEEISVAESLELKAPITLATGGIVTQTNFAAASDYLGGLLYLGESGKASSTAGSTFIQVVGRLLTRDRIFLSTKITHQLSLDVGAPISLVTAANSADDAIDNLIEGSSRDHQGTASNSVILSNVTDDGDIQMLVSDGGHSKEFLLANGDTADLVLGHGMTTATVKTASGILTLAPGGNIVASSSVDIQGGYANGGGAPYDGVVDAAGGGNWTTLAAGEAALGDATPSTYTMLVKSGTTYSTTSSTITFSTNGARIVVEPGTTIVDPITLGGDNVTLVLGAGCDVQGAITLEGVGCSLVCENGCDIDGIVMSGNYGYVNGGGWETISDGGTARFGVGPTGTDCIVENIAIQTTAGGGTTYDALYTTGARTVIRNCKIIDSDENGISIVAADCAVEGNLILGADDHGIAIFSARARVVGNHTIGAGDIGIRIAGGGTDSAVTGNIVQGQGGDSIDINTSGEDCIVSGNRTDGAIDDNSGTSVVANLNDETAI
jgi:hypothetical protein